MQKLSRREKGMIGFLAFFILAAAAVYFVFMPMMREYRRLEADIDMLQAQSDQLSMAIDLGRQLDGPMAEVTAQVSALADRLAPPSAGEITRRLTQYIQQAGLLPASLTVSGPEAVSFAAYDPYPAPAPDDPEEPQGPTAPVYTATAVFSGSVEDFIALAHRISGESYVRIASAACSGLDAGDCSFSVTFILVAPQ